MQLQTTRGSTDEVYDGPMSTCDGTFRPGGPWWEVAPRFPSLLES